MFEQLSTEGLPRLETYAEALARYENTKPIRGRDTRPLGKRSHHHTKQIIKLHDGSIVCRLHYTDVLTYHPDDSITVVPYESVTTDVFFNRVAPFSLHSNFSMGGIGGSLLWLRRPGYGGPGGYGVLIGMSLRVKRSGDAWAVHPESEEPVPFIRYSLDQSVTRKLYADYRYNEFRTWFKALLALGALKEHEPPANTTHWALANWQRANAISRYDIRRYAGDTLAALKAGPEEWRSIVERWGARDAMLNAVRMCVLHDAATISPVVIEEKLPHIETWGDVHNIRASHRRWQYL
jgi:hypothetical protein